MDEKTLIEKCISGDRKAWDQFVETYMPAIYAAVVNAIAFYNASDDPNDVVQEVFLKIVGNKYKILKDFKFKSSLKTYLSVIAAHEVTRCLKNKKTIQLDVDLLLKDLGETEPKDERIILVNKSLGRLLPRDRLALKLFYVKGLSYKELAKALGVSMNAIGPLLDRARQRLKEIFTQLPS